MLWNLGVKRIAGKLQFHADRVVRCAQLSRDAEAVLVTAKAAPTPGRRRSVKKVTASSSAISPGQVDSRASSGSGT
jgi:hypothetical protein